MWAIAHKESGIYEDRFKQDLVKLTELGYIIKDGKKYRTSQRARLQLDSLCLSSNGEKVYDPTLVGRFLGQRWHMLYLCNVNTTADHPPKAEDFEKLAHKLYNHECWDTLRKIGLHFAFILTPIMAGNIITIQSIWAMFAYFALIGPWMFWAGRIITKEFNREN
jgi:hypothetical protein